MPVVYYVIDLCVFVFVCFLWGGVGVVACSCYIAFKVFIVLMLFCGSYIMINVFCVFFVLF